MHKCPKCGEVMHKQTPTPGGKQRWICRGTTGARTYCYSTTNPKAEYVQTQSGKTKRSMKTSVFKRTLGGVTTLLITAAQNATPAHKGFVKACENFCEHRSAELIAVPMRYKNPTSHWSASQANEDVWADELVPYLCNERKKLNKNLILLGDVKVQPTATSPLTGFEALTHGESGVLAHTKLQLRTVATPQSRMPKILTTTGAATLRNYTDSKAGKLGEFHHTLGACLVEMKGKKFHIRQINADKKTGSFIDLNTQYGVDWMNNGRAEARRALAIDIGDTHVEFTDKKVTRATDEMTAFFRPQYKVWNDLLDGYAFNPHHTGNPFISIAKALHGKQNARAEVMRAIAYLAAHTPDNCTSIVVPSNHDDFLARWIVGQDWRNTGSNAEFYLETALAMAQGVEMTKHGTQYPSPFTYWGRKKLAGSPNIRFLDRDESFMVADIEVGMHGDKGPNGARGSIKNLRRIGVKSIIGHTHSPGIEEGCYQVGTSTPLRLEYTTGPSSWLNTHCIVYANGKRTLINIIDGEWRL